MMKKITTILTIAFCGMAGLFSACSSASSEPWKKSQLMEPADLAAMIKEEAPDQPKIICIGPGALIPGSEDVGQTGEQANLNKLKTLLADVDREQKIVLYCGCCPFEKCPNIRPAFTLLNEMEFKQHKLLNLSTNLKTDWIDQGYPTTQ